MTGIYFSGTGNTKFCVDKFLKEYDCSKNSFSIEDSEALERIKNDDEIVMGYPVQYSNIPKILRDYIVNNRYVWKGKNIFIIATMGLFSGDGAGILARLLKNYGAVIVGGLHLKMPDSICDERALKRSFEHNKRIVVKATEKICKCVDNIKNGKSPTLSPLHFITGIDIARKENIPVRYFGFASARKCAEQLAVDEIASAD